jgi:hypothetical protein
MKSFLCRYDHVSMSWTNFESLKSFAPMIEVDKHYSFPSHVHSPWSTTKCSLVKLWIFHFWNVINHKVITR